MSACLDVSQPFRIELYKAKLRGCCQVYNFKDQKAETAEKEVKKATLMELVDYLNANKAVFCKEVMAELMLTVKANIFRTLGGGPVKKKEDTEINITSGKNPPVEEDDEPNLEE